MNPMRTRHSWQEKLFGFLNIGIAALGLLALLCNAAGYYRLPSEFVNQTPVIVHVFHSMLVGSALLLIPLLYAGIVLVRGQGYAILFCNLLYVLEILFLIVFWYRWPLPISPLSITALRGGFLNLGLAIQVISGYPLIALLVLNFAGRSRQEMSGPRQ